MYPETDRYTTTDDNLKELLFEKFMEEDPILKEIENYEDDYWIY